MWREGAWLDLWSVVHALSGISIGLGLYVLSLGMFASCMIVLLLLVSYEMWEMLVQIVETPANRCMDIVVGMAGFLSAFFIFAPRLSLPAFSISFGLVLAANVVMSVFGWRASQKAAALKKRMSAKYAARRVQLLERSARLRERFRRKGSVN